MAKNTHKQDLKVQFETVDDADMSNLWKALRDVSRDVDPTVGFEAHAPGSLAEARGSELSVTELAKTNGGEPVHPGSPRPGEPQWSYQPAALAASSPAAARPQSAIARPRTLAPPVGDVAGAPAVESTFVRPTPPRRVPSGTPLQFDAPRVDAERVAPAPQPQQANGPIPDAVVNKLARALNASAGPGGARSYLHPVGQPAPAPPAGGSPNGVRAFASATPDMSLVMAIVANPNWRPGDDDVLPSDGHRGVRRPRLRERLGL